MLQKHLINMANINQKNKPPIFEKASSALKKLKPNVTAEDRKLAMKAFNLSDVTIVNYLKGDVRDLSTAEKLFVFFNEKVERRGRIFNEPL